MAIATCIVKELGGYVPGTNLYRLDEPIDGVSYVAVMAVDNPGTQYDETIIVATDQNGAARNMMRLRGSLVGWADHEKALNLAGYDVGPDELLPPEPVGPVVPSEQPTEVP